MNRVLMIAHAGPLFGAVAGQLAEYGIETMTIEKEAITSREEAKKLSAGMGSFDGVIHSVLLDAEEYPCLLYTSSVIFLLRSLRKARSGAKNS